MSSVYLRNTISGVTMEVSEAEAEAILSHPKHSLVNEIVDTHKDAPLAAPHTIDPVTGESVPVDKKAEKVDASHDVIVEPEPVEAEAEKTEGSN